MSEAIIQVKELSKKYIIGHQRPKMNVSIRDALINSAKGLVNRFKHPSMGMDREDFWALEDISFEVKSGEKIGIIGRNGAGKSTLLKTLSRITSPTRGQIRIKGRVASLLEVGTGFHPELTGRENIFLNGAILGMGRSEIKRKFDEIVDFAGIEKFLDTPVKRFSSGMYVRLAFAVAAHLEPEILLVDEVLAVGDIQFQKKCLGKMENVAEKEGRTIIFVSHQMAAIQNICKRCLYLKQGRLIKDDKTSVIIEQYLADSQDFSGSLIDRADRKGRGDIRFSSLSLQDEDQNPINSVYCGQSFSLIIYFQNNTKQSLRHLHIAVGIENEIGQRIAYLSSDLIDADFYNLPEEADHIRLNVQNLPLLPGRYSITLFSHVSFDVADWIQEAFFLDVEPGNFYGTGKLPKKEQGIFLLNYSFQSP
jgi:lipopolysaccharide transport system ATP-binding protein